MQIDNTAETTNKFQDRFQRAEHYLNAYIETLYYQAIIRMGDSIVRAYEDLYYNEHWPTDKNQYDKLMWRLMIDHERGPEDEISRLQRGDVILRTESFRAVDGGMYKIFIRARRLDRRYDVVLHKVYEEMKFKIQEDWDDGTVVASFNESESCQYDDAFARARMCLTNYRRGLEQCCVG